MIKLKVVSALLLITFSAVSLKSETYTIDAAKNCVFLNRQQNNIPEKSIKIKLDMNARYRVELSGDCFYTGQTGRDADYMPGAVVFYATNEEDGFRSVYSVLKPGQVIEFTTPNEDPENIFLIAFVLDYWPESSNRGAYSLKVTKI